MARIDPQMKLRMQAELRDRVAQAANAAGRSLNAEIVARLEKSFEQPGELRLTADSAGLLSYVCSTLFLTDCVLGEVTGLDTNKAKHVQTIRARAVRDIGRIGVELANNAEVGLANSVEVEVANLVQAELAAIGNKLPMLTPEQVAGLQDRLAAYSAAGSTGLLFDANGKPCIAEAGHPSPHDAGLRYTEASSRPGGRSRGGKRNAGPLS